LVVGFETSDQMEPERYEELKIFLKDMLKNYDISPNKVRISLLNFGSKQKTEIDLKNGISEDALKTAIQRITKLGN